MENQKKEGSDVLLGLSHVFEGDVEAIIDIVVKKRERPPFNIVSIKESLHSDYITILDEGFPKRFTNYFRPPMVMYYKGDIWIHQQKIYMCRSPKLIFLSWTKRTFLRHVKINPAEESSVVAAFLLHFCDYPLDIMKRLILQRLSKAVSILL